MNNDLPLIMLLLAGLLVILLIVYGIRYKLNSKRRWPSHTRPTQEPKPNFTEAENPVTNVSQKTTELDGIIGDVTIRYVEQTQHPQPITFRQNKPTKASQLLILHVMAVPDRTFMGYELLQSLLSAGLRFGEMNIFHRYEQANGQGEIIFSLASATEPGTFNLDEVGSLNCVGLSLFMDASRTANPEKVFTLMLDTARLLAEDLGGIVYDEQYQEFTPDKLAHYQQLIAV